MSRSKIVTEVTDANAHYVSEFGDNSHPLVPATIPIYGYIYDVKTGRLVEVPAATEAGKAG